MAVSLNERISGGLIGALAGDACGVPYEFHLAFSLPPSDQLDMVPPPGFPRSHARIAPGRWSDDGAQLLCLPVSLLDRKNFQPRDFVQELLRC